MKNTEAPEEEGIFLPLHVVKHIQDLIEGTMRWSQSQHPPEFVHKTAALFYASVSPLLRETVVAVAMRARKWEKERQEQETQERCAECRLPLPE